MTIYFDPGTVIVAVILAIISVSATWYFSKRYYTRESRLHPVTDNDLQAQANRYNFWAVVIIFVALILFAALVIVGPMLLI